MNQFDDAIRQQYREAAKAVPCRFCGAQKGEGCVNPTSGLLLVKIPAHNFRLQDAGVFPRGGSHGRTSASTASPQKPAGGS